MARVRKGSWSLVWRRRAVKRRGDAPPLFHVQKDGVVYRQTKVVGTDSPLFHVQKNGVVYPQTKVVGMDSTLFHVQKDGVAYLQATVETSLSRSRRWACVYIGRRILWASELADERCN